MKFVDEFRDPAQIRRLAEEIARVCRRDWTLMEVCGGQTHAIMKFGLHKILPPRVQLLHGPGCPVCVTPAAAIDHAIQIAKTPGVIFCSFGDMLRVPGSRFDLLSARSEGADVRIVYSPLEALALARSHPERQVVFFAVGFETTAPASAMAVFQAAEMRLSNFSVLVSHVLVPPALMEILSEPSRKVHGVLAAGHVCSIAGIGAYKPLAERYRVPIVVTGFEPLDILMGVLMCVRQLESGRHEVENQYVRAVRGEGNRHARSLIDLVFEVTDQPWRGMGVIPLSGLRLRPAFRQFAAAERFPLCEDISGTHQIKGECLSGRVLQGLIRPDACPAFGRECTPDHPLGATMVSNEGACAAYFRYGSHR
jgi:hydrogenase expression/formation protein HypD